MSWSRSVVLIVPGRLDTCSGGYEYDRRILAGLRDRGWSVEVRELDGSFPRPTPMALDQAARVLAEIPAGMTVLMDGLALGALPAQVEREAARLQVVALVHHPLAAETGLSPQEAATLERSEKRALAAVRSVVVTSRATARSLAPYDVTPDRAAVVEPGTDRAPLASGSREGCVHLLSVAAIIPRKGHDVLLRALAAVPERNWRLTCLGSLERDPATVERLRARMSIGGLRGRVTLAGEGDRATVDACYDSADIFVMPTLYEGYGMAVAEALARGLPVVGTSTGAIPELLAGIPGCDAGLLVPPGDVGRLAAALSLVVGDAETRERLARGARQVRDHLPTWAEASEKMARVLGGAAGRS